MCESGLLAGPWQERLGTISRDRAAHAMHTMIF